MRNAVREAALQLRPLAESPYRLAVVLANPNGFFAANPAPTSWLCKPS
jgi:hypothetical protein